MTKAYYNNIIAQSCGVGELGMFREEDNASYHKHIKDIKPVGGCGWTLAGFTDRSPVFKQAYEEMCERWGKPIFQSKVRKNKRTNNKFFFAIWDTKK